ncbi:NlpC/P60 family protein [Spirillospora sp. CA-108201]
MADHDGGRVRMRIEPSINPPRFGREIHDRLDGTVTEVGAKLGRRLGKAMSKGAGKGFVVGDVVEAVRKSGARVSEQAGKVGRRAGRELARELKTELQERLRTLKIPPVTVKAKVQVDSESLNRARRRIADIGPVDVRVEPQLDPYHLDRIRGRLAGLGPVQVGVSVKLDEWSEALVRRRIADIGPVGVRVEPQLDRYHLDRIRERLAALGPVQVGVSVKLDEWSEALVRRRLATIGKARAIVEVKLDEWSLERVRQRIAGLGPFQVTINADLDTAAAMARLLLLRQEADRLFSRGINLNAGVNTGAASGQLRSLALQLAAITAIPLGTSLAAGIGALAAGFTAATAGAVGFAAVAVPGVRKVAEALQAQKAVQDAVNTATSTGINTADQARLRALQMVGAERQVANAKAAARTAEEALTMARRDARRAMEDLTNQVRSGALAERRATLQLKEARENLDKTLADPKATELARQQAQLAVDEALQQLDEQRLATKRLRQDKAAADRAGINGSQQVKSAQQQLTQALQQVGDAQRQITALQIQDRMAQRQAAAAANTNTAAQQKLAKVMGELSPAERGLLDDWEKFRGVYKAWVRDLEPDVLPVLGRGLDIVGRGLNRATPLVKGTSQAFGVLLDRAEAGLKNEFWTEFIEGVGIEAPVAIVQLGSIFGHTVTGMAGVLNAFMPEVEEVFDFLDSGAARFEDWGKNLAGSNGFNEFMDYARANGRIVAEDIGAISHALLEVGKAVAPVTMVYTAGIKPLAEGTAALAEHTPILFQYGAAILIAAKAARMLGLTALVAGFRGTATAAGAAGAGMLRLGTILRSVGAWMMGVSAQAATTRTALLGLGRAAGLLLGFYAASQAINHFVGSTIDAKPRADELADSLVKLGRTGEMTGPLLRQFGDGLGDLGEQARKATDPTTSEQIANWGSTIVNTLYGQAGITEQIKNNYRGLDQALKGLAENGRAAEAKAAFDQLSAALKRNGVDANKINELLPEYTRLLYYGGGATAALNSRLQEQNRELAINANRFMNSQQELIDFNNALSSGREALNRNGRAFAGNSRAASDNRQQIINGARVLNQYSDQLVNNNEVTDKNLARLRKQREQLIDMAEKFTGSRKEAKKYVDQLLHIPPKASTDVTVNAKGKLSMKGLGNLVNDPVLGGILKGVMGNAGGGYIAGPGDPRGDGLLTRISPGEMVINATATARHLPTLAAWNDAGNKGTIYKGKGYAGGGIPQPTAWTLPAGPESWTPPGYAGGGIPKSLGAASYKRGYHYDDDAAAALAKATRANAAMLAGAITYAGGQTAIAAGLIQQALAGGSGSKAVQFAVQQLGEPYRWGATGPDQWDCSGLTQAAWRAAGVSIPRVTYDQIASGTPTSRAQAVPGDLFFPHTGHVMMVTGMGGSKALIHAPRTGDVVRYAPWRSGGTYRHIGSSAAVGWGGGTPKAYARAQFGEFGWGGNQWAPLDSLWERESGWRWNARNASSGAYGIPQALPPQKMAAAGSDWLTNWATQINWGLGYIQGRYGSPAGAWRHSQNTGWYARGTNGAAPGLAWVGEEGPELVRFKGGETVYPHEESMRIGRQIAQGYASGTPSRARLKPVQADLKGLTKDLTSSVGKIRAALKDLTSDITKAYKGIRSTTDNRLNTYVTRQGKQLQNLAARRDKLASSINAGKALAKESTESAREFASLTGLPTGLQADASGLYAEGEVFNAKGIIGGLQTRVKQLNAFKANLGKLAKLGVSKELISQIIAAGPDRGASYAQALADATPKQVKELNAAQKAIGTAATNVGKQAGDAMYDAGSQAGKGFLAGLEAEKKAIERAMGRIAKAIRDQIRKALKIRSPSRVMAELGEQVGAGLALGIDTSLVEVQTSVDRMAGLIVPTPVPAAAAPAPVPAGRGGLTIEELHIHEVTDKATRQAVNDALHDVYVLHRPLL